MTSPAATRALSAVRRNLRLGMTAVVLLVGGLGGWAALADITGAVIALGTLVVESNVKKVQHPTGGIVGELRVRDGDEVHAGDVLIRLDETVSRANLAIASKALDELMARRARLEAERDGRDTIAFPAALVDRAEDPEVSSRIESEMRAFATGRQVRDGEKAQLRERIAQLKESIAGYDVRQQAKAKEIEFIERELTGARKLHKKGLLPISKLTALEREATRLDGERGQFMSLISEAKGKITETELQILQVDHELRKDVARELREIESRIGELVERKIAAEDQLKRIDIRAPQTGHVHQLAVHTVGGVIAAGEPVMLIVPEGDDLSVEAKVAPGDIDQIQVGQVAMLRFSAFNRHKTPELKGRVRRVSADIQSDPRTGGSYYLVRIDLSDDEWTRLAGVKLVPGMPVEVFIETGERKALSYLMKPLTDQMQRAFRED